MFKDRSPEEQDEYIRSLGDIIVGLDIVETVLDPYERVYKLELHSRIWGTAIEDIDNEVRAAGLDNPTPGDRMAVLDYLVDESILFNENGEFYRTD